MKTPAPGLAVLMQSFSGFTPWARETRTSSLFPGLPGFEGFPASLLFGT